jgi:site-specific DNA-cytosine methylase
MNVLSLFDGISCGQYVLRKMLNIKVDNYFASEIDTNAIACTMHHFPKTIQLGDVTKIDTSKLPKIDLLIGGSPCQGFSFSGKGLAFDDPRSKLFFEYVRIYRELRAKNPKLKVYA